MGPSPKQFCALKGAQTMLQLTFTRVADQTRFADPVLITSAGLGDESIRQLQDEGIVAGLLILEPTPRNTAPAVELAASVLPTDALMLVMPSDHLVGDVGAFLDAVQTAASLAQAGWLVTFGVRPTRPETGYGYVGRGDEIEAGAFRVDRFVEKPDLLTANSYVADGRYDWNAGIFMFRAGTYLEELQRHAADIAQSVEAAMDQSVREGITICPNAKLFEAVRSMSIDYAVMERAARVAVVPVEMAWSDLGSWQALYEASEKDAQGNVIQGPTEIIDSINCLIWSEGPLVTAVGVQDVAIIATGDAVLVIPRKDSQRVGELVNLLRARESI